MYVVFSLAFSIVVSHRLNKGVSVFDCRKLGENEVFANAIFNSAIPSA
jgi:hypothetical protein